MSDEKHPDQPIVIVDGVVLFKKNQIVRDLLDKAKKGEKFDLNDIYVGDYTDSDRIQFYQLIGYSVDAFGEIFNDEHSSLVSYFDTMAKIELKRVKDPSLREG